MPVLPHVDLPIDTEAAATYRSYAEQHEKERRERQQQRRQARDRQLCNVLDSRVRTIMGKFLRDQDIYVQTYAHIFGGRRLPSQTLGPMAGWELKTKDGDPIEAPLVCILNGDMLVVEMQDYEYDPNTAPPALSLANRLSYGLNRPVYLYYAENGQLPDHQSWAVGTAPFLQQNTRKARLRRWCQYYIGWPF